jgi:serine/threonine protein phosphatase PrpC
MNLPSTYFLPTLALLATFGFGIIFARLLPVKKRTKDFEHSEKSNAPVSGYEFIGRTPSEYSFSDYAATVLSRRLENETENARFEIATSSIRGSAHIQEETSRQDSVGLFRGNGFTVISISDGVSSSPQSHIGSSFLVTNLERVFKSEFGEKPNADPAQWANVNKTLTENFVSMHVARLKQAGKASTSSFSNLRVEAAELYAATLQVLICFDPSTEDLNIPYIFVSLAGDGSLLLDDGNVTSRIFPSSLPDKWTNGNYVDALPIFDETAQIISGTIPTGKALLFCSDGVGDFLETNENWIGTLRALTSGRLGYESILRFITFHNPESTDDRSLAVVRLHK